jgi:hypothetical protein
LHQQWDKMNRDGCGAAAEAKLDLRLGTMAVQKGLITAAQLDAGARGAELGVQRGTQESPRRLGVILPPCTS